MDKKKGLAEKPKIGAQTQAARQRVKKAQAALEQAKERWREAKQKRKEAKQAARKARKAFKRAKAELAEAQAAVETALAKTLKIGPPPGKEEPMTKPHSPSSRSETATPRKVRSKRVKTLAPNSPGESPALFRHPEDVTPEPTMHATGETTGSPNSPGSDVRLFSSVETESNENSSSAPRELD